MATAKKDRRRELLKRHRMSEKRYAALLHSQKGCCAICFRYPSKTRRLAIDHDHRTNVKRGLLCTRCNVALGLFNDDTDVIKDAIRYLYKYQGRW